MLIIACTAPAKYSPGNTAQAGLPDCAIYRKKCGFRSPDASRFEVRLAPFGGAILRLEKVRKCDFCPKSCDCCDIRSFGPFFDKSALLTT